MIFTLIVRSNVMFYRQTVCNHMNEEPTIAKHCHHNRQITQHDAVFAHSLKTTSRFRPFVGKYEDERTL